MLKCAHVICKVSDIKQAVIDFRKLGFSVEWGSNPKKADNALIWFNEGPFIELFEEKSFYYKFNKMISIFCGSAAGNKLRKWYLMKEGWCDVAGEDINNNENIIEDAKANCKQLDDLRKKIQRIDLDTSKVIKWSRRKPNGKIVRYSIFYLSPVEYPFVVSKYDSLQRPRKIVHENGALEIEKIIISVPPKMIKKYMYLFKNDSRIEIRKGNSLAISNVLIKGISCDLNKNLMHGAKINLQEGGL